MVFQAVRTRFPLRIAAGMTELGLLQEPRLFNRDVEDNKEVIHINEEGITEHRPWSME